jgi:putative hemolysin
VTETQLILFLLLGFTLGLSLLTAAARASIDNASLARLLGQTEVKETQFSRNIPLLSSIFYTRAGLHWLQILLHFALAGLAAAVFLPWIDESGDYIWIAAILIMIALLTSWLEWIISERAVQNADQWGPKLTPVSKVLTSFLYPLLVFTLKFSPQLTGAEPGINPIIEEEIKNLVDNGQQDGILEKEERKMIYSIFRLGDTLAREIMIPRIDIMAVDVQTPLAQAVDTLLSTGFSRVPVYEDTVDNVLGVLYTKDLLKVWREGNELSSLRSLLRSAYFVPEAKKVDELLAEMQSRRVHMAVVVDEYGGVAGVVTLEDIVEEIVGEIQDEYDQAEELPYQELGDGQYIFQGRVDLDDFNEVMGSYLPKEEADTIGGFIYNRIGRVPTAGETLQIDNLLLVVEQVTGRRIRKVRASWVPVEVAEKEETNVDK